MRKGYCDFCGQRLTDASGSWLLSDHDLGIMKRPTMRIVCCSACHADIMVWLTDYAKRKGWKYERRADAD